MLGQACAAYPHGETRMHLLEDMLLRLSQRIEEETKSPELINLTRQELIEATRLLASESHNYERTSDGPDPLHGIHDEWVRRFGMPHRWAEPEDQ